MLGTMSQLRWKWDFGLAFRQVIIWFLMLVLYLIFLAVLTSFFPGNYMLPLGIVVIFALAQYFFSDKLVLMSTGAKPALEDEYPNLHAMVAHLAERAEIPKPRVYVMTSPVPNAFATGRSPKKRCGLCHRFNHAASGSRWAWRVLAHELSHIKNRDILTMTVASFLAMIAFMIMRYAFWGSLFNSRDSGGSYLVIIAVAVVVGVVSQLLMRLLSRYREFAADRGSAYITENPAALKRALQKISGKMETVPTKKKQEIEGANAFYIIPAISGESIMELFSTHPPLQKRIEALDKIEAEMRQ